MRRSPREEEEWGATGARGCLCLKGCKREKQQQKKGEGSSPGMLEN